MMLLLCGWVIVIIIFLRYIANIWRGLLIPSRFLDK